MSIKSTLDSLPVEQQRQLLYAFEHEFAQFIELPGKRFIGVNIAPIKHLRVEESAGVWAIGEIKKED
jgi:hypothetical protein